MNIPEVNERESFFKILKPIADGVAEILDIPGLRFVKADASGGYAFVLRWKSEGGNFKKELDAKMALINQARGCFDTASRSKLKKIAKEEEFIAKRGLLSIP